MPGKFFLDSNVVIYAYSRTEVDKRTTARRIIDSPLSVVSTQVLQEVANIFKRKYQLEYPAIREALCECTAAVGELHTNTSQTVLKACDIADRYRFSFYDSLIIAAALESNCTTLYSEDLQHGQVIEKSLTVCNPFLTAL